MPEKNKIALVTGGTGDLGKAIVRRLVQAGLKVLFTYHQNESAARELIRELGASQVGAYPVHNASLKETRDLAARIRENWGVVDYLVNNAGITKDRAFVQMEEEDWQEVLRVNLNMVFAFTRAFIFEMIKRPGSAMVNLSSAAALTGAAGQSNYAAAKAGVIGLSRSLAREYGKFGVRINVIAPGWIASRMVDKLPEKLKAQAQQFIPLQRFGRPEEVAQAVAFLLSEQARYIHGQVLGVDGGLAM